MKLKPFGIAIMEFGFDSFNDKNDNELRNSSNVGDLYSCELYATGEDVSLCGNSANSEAACLKHEAGQHHQELENIFICAEFKNMSGVEIIKKVPSIGEVDISFILDKFLAFFEKCTLGLETERRPSIIQDLKDGLIRLSTILHSLSSRRNLPSNSERQSDQSVNKHLEDFAHNFSEGIINQLMTSQETEIRNLEENSLKRQDRIHFLTKIDELENENTFLNTENSQMHEALADAEKRVKSISKENLQLKHKLSSFKANIKHMDDMTSEISILQGRLLQFEKSESSKKERLQKIEDDIENQKNVLLNRIHDVESWNEYVQRTEKDINALKDIICSQEDQLLKLFQERTDLEFNLNEAVQFKERLESSLSAVMEANDALRTDKQKLKENLSEIQYLMRDHVTETKCTFESMHRILYEESNESEQLIDCDISEFPDKWVNVDRQKTIEVKSGSSLQKSFGSGGDTAKVCHSDVGDQINEELRALREQLMQSQFFFTYLLKDGADHNAKNLMCKTHLHSLLEEGHLSDAILQCKSFSGQVPARFYNRSNRSSSSYASHRSTPMHCGYTSQSCPILPVESPAVTKATQTEPLPGVTFYLKNSNNGALSATSSSSLNKANFFSPSSTPCETLLEAFPITDVCEVHREPEQYSFPRHRRSSFLSAVKDGNPKLIDVSECSETNVKSDELAVVRERNISSNSNFEDTTSFFDPLSKASTSGEKFTSEDNKESIFPRKLSILLEEDYEDASSNYFSVCSSQPFLNRKKKLSSCNVKTQTDLSISSNTANELHSNKTESGDLPVKEFCLPRHGYSIVTAAIQKKTVFSEELPHKHLLRHPPPYTNIRSKSSGSVTSGTFLKESHSKPKTHMYKWATISEYLPSKSEHVQNFPKRHCDSSLQTRHLSLEKQESFSCDHSLYPESLVSSITDCSGWIQKSDTVLNSKPDPPSYKQSVVASNQRQSTRNRFKDVSKDKKHLDSKQRNPLTTASDLAKHESTSYVYEEKSETKEKNSKSQRSMRRGSGAGSPNSQLSIPRYPAFDFGEQEDAQSLFPSPLEPEANLNIKTGNLQGIKNSELLSDKDLQQHDPTASKEGNLKKPDIGKSKTLMPELENSETESAKGSFECEVPDLPPSLDTAPIIDIAFPNLPNTFLAKLGVHKDSPLPVEAFDEQELESKFIALSLAFKTDRTTLSKRLELHKRYRDMAEKNVENEFRAMREDLNALNLKATRADIRDLISKIQNHVDICQQATARVSGRSETYGAVQQEERVSRAFEVLILHVDHLKRLFDKEHKELEETRKMLTNTQVLKKEVSRENVSEDQKKYLKSFGFPVGSIKSVGRRRASVADLHQSTLTESYRPSSFNRSWTSGFVSRKEREHHTLWSPSTVSSVGLSSSSLPASHISPTFPPRINSGDISNRRCSLPATSPLDPNILQISEAATQNADQPQQLSSLDKPSIKEKKFWIRKLSAVRDEKEHESESEYNDDIFNERMTETLETSEESFETSEEFFHTRNSHNKTDEKSNVLISRMSQFFCSLQDNIGIRGILTALPYNVISVIYSSLYSMLIFILYELSDVFTYHSRHISARSKYILLLTIIVFFIWIIYTLLLYALFKQANLN